MLKSYSIAEAKNHFTELVHDLETESTIQVTRRGKPVAIMLSVQQYQQLNSKRSDFWEALLAFRAKLDALEIDLDPESFLSGVRDRAPGREFDWK